MRIWLSPELETIEVGPDDGHSTLVRMDPERYGMDAETMADYEIDLADEKLDLEFDFDAVIVLAEMAGWVRVARDASGGRLAVSASDARTARKAISHLEKEGTYFPGIELNLEKIVGDVIVSDFHRLDEDELGRFVRHGRLPDGKRDEMSFDAVDFVRRTLAILEERDRMPRTAAGLR